MIDTAALVAKDMMATSFRTTSPTERVHTAVKVMLKHGISGMPVVDEQHALVGMLTQKDCIRALIRAVDERLPASLVRDVMTTGDLLTVEESTHVLTIAHLFLTRPVRFLPVIKDDRLVGQITRRDLLRATITVFEQAPDRDSAVLYLSALPRGHHDKSPANDGSFDSNRPG